MQGLRLRLPATRIAELLFAALVMALLTLFIGDLPELEVIETTIKDDQFTDLVVTTQGQIPIDSNIVVVPFGPEILDENEWVDRSLLAQQLLALFEYHPRIVAVDYLIEEVRPDQQIGDEMMTGLIADHPQDLILGIFREDSLDTWRYPPSSFGIDSAQLGAINFDPGEDMIIRMFRPVWRTGDGRSFESLALRTARISDPEAAQHLLDYNAEEYVIDYAGSLGELQQLNLAEGNQVFPSFPLSEVADALFAGDTAREEYFRERLQGKTVLVGYADLSGGQLTSIHDRFYTPLKPEKNSLPDMYGVTIHANVLNSILQRRIVFDVPGWMNVLWGTLFVFLMYYGYEALDHVRPRRKRAILIYSGWALLLLIALLLPTFFFRYTPYKFSIYTPFAGLILGRLVLTVYDRLKRIVLDYSFRRELRTGLSNDFRVELDGILNRSNPSDRYIHALHVVQRIFHSCADLMFAEAMSSPIGFSRQTVGAPTPTRILSDLSELDSDLRDHASSDFVAAVRTIQLIHDDPQLRTALRLARSLVIALNEINRQNAMLDEDEPVEENGSPEGSETGGYTDMVMTAMSGGEIENDFERSDRLFRRLLAVGREMSVVTPANERPLPITDELVEERNLPFILREQCLVHNRKETFVYLSEQEDANNRDDYYDLIYCGESVHCRTASHPGLSRFREMIADSTVVRSGEQSIVPDAPERDSSRMPDRDDSSNERPT